MSLPPKPNRLDILRSLREQQVAKMRAAHEKLTPKPTNVRKKKAKKKKD